MVHSQSDRPVRTYHGTIGDKPSSRGISLSVCVCVCAYVCVCVCVCMVCRLPINYFYDILITSGNSIVFI